MLFHKGKTSFYTHVYQQENYNFVYSDFQIFRKETNTKDPELNDNSHFPGRHRKGELASRASIDLPNMQRQKEYTVYIKHAGGLTSSVHATTSTGLRTIKLLESVRHLATEFLLEFHETKRTEPPDKLPQVVPIQEALNTDLQLYGRPYN
jgi:hypothetical protein